MPRNITVTFEDGSTHIYQNAPDDVTPDQIMQRASREFGGTITALDGGNKSAQSPQIEEPTGLNGLLVGAGKRLNEAAQGLGFDGIESYAPADKAIDNSTSGKIGSMVADAALTAPAGLAGGALSRIGLTGLTEGLTNKDDRVTNALSGAAGAGLGEGISSTLKFLNNPFKSTTNPVKDDLIIKASAMGIPLNAAQQTGNKSLQYMDSALDSIPSSSGFQQAQKDAQRQAWQKALFAQGGENADGATSDVMGAMKDRISGAYNDIHGRNNLIVDQELKDALTQVEQNQLSRLPTNQRPVVQSYLDDFNGLNIGDKMTGNQYQDLRSMLDKQAQGFKHSDPFTADALKTIRGATDSAMARNIAMFDAPKLKSANNDWAVMKSMERAIDPTTGNVSPALLINGLKKQDANRVLYGKGNQDLTDIAKVGKEFISSKVPDSGTAQRAAMIKMLTGAGAAGVGADMATGDDLEGSVGTGLLSMIAAATLPKAAAKAMWKNNGYLSKGLLDLNKGVIPGVTRGGLLDFASRNTGLQTSKALRD